MTCSTTATFGGRPLGRSSTFAKSCGSMSQSRPSFWAGNRPSVIRTSTRLLLMLRRVAASSVVIRLRNWGTSDLSEFLSSVVQLVAPLAQLAPIFGAHDVSCHDSVDLMPLALVERRQVSDGPVNSEAKFHLFSPLVDTISIRHKEQFVKGQFA